MTPARKLEQTLHEEIPITQAMDITVPFYDGRTLQLAAPLAPNINHKRTAFGGSLYALAVSCGWGMVHLKLEELGKHFHIVIQEADIKYLLPVDGDMLAECVLDAQSWQRFYKMLQKHGRSRLALQVRVLHQRKLAVEFNGCYVVYE